MDLYEEKDRIISSDEYSDDDDAALMNDAVRAQYDRISDYNERDNQPKWRIDQKQKELSSLIRRNKISVIYKNRSIRWLNNKWKRERYKQRVYSKSNNGTIGQLTHTAVASLELEQHQKKKKKKSSDQKCNTMLNKKLNSEQMINTRQIFEDNASLQMIPSTGTSIFKTQATNLQPEEDGKIACEKGTYHEKNIEKLRSPFQKTEGIPEKRTRSSSPPNLNESTEMDVKHIGKKFKAVSPQFYKGINDMFTKFDKIATNHIGGIANTLLTAVEDKLKSLSNEIDILNEILQVKEVEWNRLSHLKMVKEEIHSRLNKKKHILQLNESFSNKRDQNILLELKELEFYLTENKTTPETNHSSVTIKKLIENRASMNVDDLKREKNNTSRLHSLLVSQNMLNDDESLKNTCAISNGEKYDLKLPSKNSEMFNNRGRQGDVRDVKSLIADFRQKNQELLPREGTRIKFTESNTHRQGYSIPHLEETSRAQLFTKNNHEISIDGIGRSKKLLSCHDIDFVNAVNNQYNVRLEDTVFKNQVKGDFNGKCSRNIQYPLCQECKIKESRFVCAGCEKQWYCSKKCQISAWDKHSELCTE